MKDIFEITILKVSENPSSSPVLSLCYIAMASYRPAPCRRSDTSPKLCYDTHHPHWYWTGQLFT